MNIKSLPKVIFTFLAVGLIMAVVLVGTAFAQGPVTPAEKERFIVEFNVPVQANDKAFINGLGGQVIHEYTLVSALAVEMPATALAGLQHNPRVKVVSEDVEVQAMGVFDDEYAATWSIANVNAKPVHDAGNTGNAIKVGIIDSGVNYNHPDLETNYVGGDDFVTGDGDPMDVYGHGTHVAGTVCATMNTWGAVGVAPDCALYALRVLNDSGSGYTSDIIAAVEWATQNNLDVINLSLGSTRDPGPTAHAAYDAAYNAGVLVVAAAGNSGNQAGKGKNTIWPANYDSVIAVAATDINDDRAYFSSTGPDVELSAPGYSVHSTWNDNTSPHDPQPVCDGSRGCYKDGSGTSMASPQVAGVAALVIAAANSDISNEEVRTILQNTAIDLGSSGRDKLFGFGLVDALAAVEAVNPLPRVNQAPEADAGTYNDVVVGEPLTFDGSGSSDDDGIDSYNWDFGDGSTGTGVAPVHTYQATGTYNVSLTVTDTDAVTAQAFATVSVVDVPPPADILLSVTGEKYRGSMTAYLTWSPTAAGNVDIYLDGNSDTTTSNDGAYTDDLGKGGGIYTYQVCEEGTEVCSNEVIVSF